MKVVAFLPAKGNSERVSNKNIQLLDGKPLFLHTLEKLVECDFIDEVYLDSESEEIFSLAEHLGHKVLKRDPNLASNKTDGHQLFYNEVRQVEADIYIQILGTSPFIKKETIKKGIEILKENEEYDSVVLVKKDKQYLWKDNQPIYDKNHIPNSIDLPDTLIETMGLYIVRSSVAHNEKKRFGNNSYLLEATPIEALDVNFPEDLELAQVVAAGIREKSRKLYKNLAGIFNSAIFSDILDEMNIEGVITGLTPNLSSKKILGRASTLKIKTLAEGEDYRGIYDALKSYDQIVAGDIILVENECCDKAYFGELNANLAVRAGAVGAIIGGKTRDSKEVEDLDFPVFSTGYCCSDVRGRATLESINKPIQINGVNIKHGDLVFADRNGIIIIPRQYENEILSKAIKVVEKEKKILEGIVGNRSSMDILGAEGEF